MVLRTEDKVKGIPGPPAEAMVRTYWPRFGFKPMPQRVARGPVLEAKVRQGRWIAECPFCPELGSGAGAEYVSPDDPRFFCMACDNSGVQGDWLPVEFPGADRLREVEDLLDRRNYPQIQNWEAKESIEQLREENKDLEKAQAARPNIIDLGRL